MNEQPPPPKARHPFIKFWKNIGGGSLTISILIHVGLLLLAGLMVVATQMTQSDIDFLPGGGTAQGAAASADMQHQVQQKKRSTLNKKMPMKKIVSNSINSEITLPEMPPDMLDIPTMPSTLGGGGLSGGFGKAGMGGGFGSGSGIGGLSGIAFKPLMMFGKELKDTRKIAVVMDVSRSMTKFLPIVAKELDKVARGSPLVLYFGCGLKTPPKDVEDRVIKVNDERFSKFWQYWESKDDMTTLRTEYAKLKYDPTRPMPLEAIYQQMVNRSNTSFIDYNGIQYASSALMSKEVMEADTIYWFADFQDAVDESEMEKVRKKLKYRKQKLYIHASVRGRSFEKVRDQLVIPLGGEVIETKAE